MNSTFVIVPKGTNLQLVLDWIASWDTGVLQHTWSVLSAPKRVDRALKTLPYKTAVGKQVQMEGKHATTAKSLCRNARIRAFVLRVMAEPVKKRTKVLVISTMTIGEILHMNNWLNGQEGPGCLNLTENQEVIAGECLLKLELRPDGSIVDDQWIDLPAK